jgi:hypothetical protein
MIEKVLIAMIWILNLKNSKIVYFSNVACDSIIFKHLIMIMITYFGSFSNIIYGVIQFIIAAFWVMISF